MLRRVMKSQYAELVLFIHDNADSANYCLHRRRTIATLFSTAIRRMTYALLATLEEKVGGYDPYALAVCNDLEQFRSIPRLDVTPSGEPSTTAINPFDVERIREFDVDVFIKLGDFPLERDILRVANYGVWSVVHTDNRVNRGGAAGFWEVFHNVPVTASTLQLLRETPDDNKVIGRSRLATCCVSVRRNRNNLYWKASRQIPWKLKELYLLGPALFFENAERDSDRPPFDSHRPSAMPRLSDEIVLLLRIFWRIYSNRIRNFFVATQWILLFDLRNVPSPSLSHFTKITPPQDRFWADPHALIKDGRNYVFIEELQYSQNKGYISAMEINEDGTHTVPRRVLEERYHLSNPFVFENDRQLFLIPESAKNRTVDLYRCVSFPDKWERCETLLRDVHAVDTTVHFHQGKWWLFTNIREHESGSSDDDLFLFFSDTLERGQWKAHPRNPIVSDVTRARPAGKIYEHEGKLFRPAQDCSIRYGYGVRILEILEMSESDYVEQEVDFIQPKWDKRIIATHSFSKAGRLIFSDALEERWEFLPSWRRSA